MSTLQGGPGNIVTNGLVLYLDAANSLSYTSGSTVWRDLSSGNNSGSLINGPTFSSGNAGSIVFDGVDDYVTVPPSNFQYNNTEVTYDVWVKIIDNPNLYRFILTASETASDTRISLSKSRSGLGNGRVYFQFYPSSGNSIIIYDTLNGSDYASLGVLNFTGVLLLEGGVYVCKLYRNGILVNSETTSISTYALNPTEVNIGKLFESLNSGYMYGNIYSVKAYNRALSPSEITQNYNATKARFGL